MPPGTGYEMAEIFLNPGKAEWDAYTAQNLMTLFSHRFAWAECLAAAYRMPIFRLAARHQSGDGTLAGILPLMFFAPPERDARLISLPYTDAAGIVADDGSIAAALLIAALELAGELGAAHVEFRQAGNPGVFDRAVDSRDGWHYEPHTFKTGLSRSLPDSLDELWSLLPAKVRNQVRKARNCGGTVAVGGVERVDDFYAVFSENMRDLGSPVHAPELFHRLLHHDSLDPRVVVVYLASKPVAAAIVFSRNATLFNPWASSLRGFRPSCPNMLLYWAMLELGVREGCRWFDFGRSSPGSSTCRFKRQWGAKLQPLTWHIFSRAPHGWSPRSESLVDEQWKTLNLATSRRLGPARRRWISL